MFEIKEDTVNEPRLPTCYKSKRAVSSFSERFLVILQLYIYETEVGKLPASIYSCPLWCIFGKSKGDWINIYI